MFVLTNAWRAVSRRWAISVLTVVVTLLVSFGTIASLAIVQASNTAHGSAYDSQTPNAVLRPTAATQATMKSDDAKSTTSRYLTLTDYEPYAEKMQEQNLTFTYSLISTVPVRQSSSIKAIAGSADTESAADKTGGEFQLRAFYDDNAVKANEFGSYHLTSGKKLTFTDTTATGALVSKAVAEKNNLKVGDKFKVGDPTDESKTYEFTVQGIYEYDDAAGSNGDGDGKYAKDNRDNVIYSAYATTYTMGVTKESDDPKNDWSKPDLDIVFQFSDTATYKKFVTLVTKAKLPKGYELVSPSLDEYEASIKPLGDAASRTRVILWVVALGGCLVLAALTIARTWFGRTDEIGMALVSGVTKPRLGWQFMVETFMLTVVPAVIGLLAGGLGAGAIGATLAGGHATPVTAGIVWPLVWESIGIVVALAIVAMLRPATFPNANLFKASEISEDKA
ncbi:FtsX-like permease family protein [Bifidobacterium parmae]|uniref:ABC transporter permease n=1 Tax=Bifidobacterium parmae TaxID=361854 RepID=A0A2N5J593_9BIFI|nr:ABC transporter permease [Bifidobacterium parmae]PLS29382.1 ABC transporter permease [Bifidobacterium parmae]